MGSFTERFGHAQIGNVSSGEVIKSSPNTPLPTCKKCGGDLFNVMGFDSMGNPTSTTTCQKCGEAYTM